MNNSRFNKITTPIPEEFIDENCTEIEPIFENKTNDKLVVNNHLEEKSLVESHVDATPVIIPNHVPIGHSVSDHVETINNLNNNTQTKINGGPCNSSMEYKHLNAGIEIKNLSGLGDNTFILPSAESFERINESVI